MGEISLHPFPVPLVLFVLISFAYRLPGEAGTSVSLREQWGMIYNKGVFTPSALCRLPLLFPHNLGCSGYFFPMLLPGG